ncbi:glycerol-3-phosphate 1-O-acyltransferase PlsB [Thalassotalea sp. PLHSN55]|uniref:glycerol-3-phosphate 1-O-acyltransferase PlsB n=1 Tax=Thalassotalea sp. PLHSN55 TaxID=3435888 RepID=UPI003F8657F1
MLVLRSLFYILLKFPVRLLVRCKVIPDKLQESIVTDDKQPTFYVVRHQSASDLLALQAVCKKMNLPDPLSKVTVGDEAFPRIFCLEKPTSLFSRRKGRKTVAIEQGLAVLEQHKKYNDIDAQLIPVNLTWGRAPTKEKNNANVGTILADQESPTWLRKFFIVLFLGRNTLMRFSEPLSFRYMADKHGSDLAGAQKVMRVARFHFHRQTIAATGPRLMHRQQMFTALLANPSIKRLLADEAKSKGISPEKVKKQALAIMDEIAGDYRDSMVRVGERILHRLWKRLYSGLKINNADVLRKVAEDGHEIIYVPCHRSHMDYLLLTYVIYHQGLVTPRIAAGINLSFWPAGPIFRKAGAFFIRRTFKGNRLYSTIFREYLGLLFERGYSVKYYTEGGRSRTGRLLPPKTGMLAMTIQSLLRGIDRPLTLVPVYIGYEHVMEVGTYRKELSGSQKKNESILGVFKAIKNLRNYGNGYINFGEPININQFLNCNVPNWKQDIDPIDPQKPTWLTPNVNKLADQVMTSVNEAAALNAVALIALILHASENKALPQAELEAELDFFLMIQRQAPYSKQLTVPEESGKELLAHVIALKKVTVDSDSFGTFISLSHSAALEMRYYRNNILHTYVVPALVCRILSRNAKVAEIDLVTQVQRIVALLKNDLFLWQNADDIETQVKQVTAALADHDYAKISKAGFWSITDNMQRKANIRSMGECIDETMQRIAIISSLVSRLAPVGKGALEEKVVAIAKRLSVLNNIDAPEFIDKKAQAGLINTMKEHAYIGVDEQGLYVANSTLANVKDVVTNLVDIEVLQSIAR